jgi:hypothetical protein
LYREIDFRGKCSKIPERCKPAMNRNYSKRINSCFIKLPCLFFSKEGNKGVSPFEKGGLRGILFEYAGKAPFAFFFKGGGERNRYPKFVKAKRLTRSPGQACEA